MENEHKKNISLKDVGNYPPFVELEISKDIKGGSAEFYDLPGYPELVARKCWTQTPDDFAKNERLEYLLKKAGEFRVIANRYHLPLAETNYVIGIDPVSGRRDLFAVTDRISGENPEECDPFRKKWRENLMTCTPKFSCI